MKLGIMQPYFFPYIGYWQLINAVDEYIIYDDVNYIKRGWINRNHILMNGERKQINLHIKDASQNRLIMDTMIAQTYKDNEALLRVLYQCYHKAPYYEEVNSLLTSIIQFSGNKLSEYLENQIRTVCAYLNIDTKIMLSSQIDKNTKLCGEEKIIAICKECGARTYINAIGGNELYHKKHFDENGIELYFLQTGDVLYKQFSIDFVPYLSIIDVMMFNSVDKIQQLLQTYTLIKGI